jgi:hypothetical protein
MRLMSPQQKNTANVWLSWAARGVLIYFASLINGKMESIERMQQQQIAHEIKIANLQDVQRDIVSNQRVFDTRINRIERTMQFRQGTQEQ